jgi:homoserine acetyltransferase
VPTLYAGGDYDPKDPPKAGLAAARMTAMLTYRSPISIDERFKRTVGLYTSNAVDPWFDRRLVSTLEPRK